MSLVQALDALQALRDALPVLKTTGFAGLDRATGGFGAGQVWIVVGSPGQGRSTLACQWAWLLANEHGLVTQLISKVDPAERVAARVVASVSKVPQDHLWRGGTTATDNERLRRVQPMLESAPLSIVEPSGLSIADADLDARPDVQAVVVDDAHRAGGMFPNRVAALASRGLLVVLTLPRTLILSGARVDPEWADAADYILDIDRPDLLDHDALRPGEADLRLSRNRWGPTQSHVVTFQGHYGQFVDSSFG